MTFDVYILKIVISYTKYDSPYLYKIMGKYINICQIVCYYTGNNIVEKSISSFVIV